MPFDNPIRCAFAQITPSPEPTVQEEIQLQRKVKSLIERILLRRQNNLDDAIEIGKLLIMAKEVVKKTKRVKWSDWIVQAGMKNRTAQEHADIARNLELLNQNGIKTITEAREFLADERRQKTFQKRKKAALKAFLSTPANSTPPKSEWFSSSTDVWHIDKLHALHDWSGLAQEDGRSGVRSTIRKSDTVMTGNYSVFPGVVMEMFLRRFAPEAENVLDCFAGGRERGVVASTLGYRYIGIDVWQAQIQENETICATIPLRTQPTYMLGDAQQARKVLHANKVEPKKFDTAFTCSPYWFLEKYPSGSAADISHVATYDEFLESLDKWALEQVELMNPGAFMGIVMGTVRDPKTGKVYDLPGDVIRAFEQQGAILWQEIVLIRNSGTAGKRAENAAAGKKLVPCHEKLIVMRLPLRDDPNGVKIERERLN